MDLNLSSVLGDLCLYLVGHIVARLVVFFSFGWAYRDLASGFIWFLLGMSLLGFWFSLALAVCELRVIFFISLK